MKDDVQAQHPQEGASLNSGVRHGKQRCTANSDAARLGSATGGNCASKEGHDLPSSAGSGPFVNIEIGGAVE